jgi:hypothetical protein
MIMLVLILLSGIKLAYFRLQEGLQGGQGKTKWLSILGAKLVLFVFLTPVTDLIVMKWAGTIDGKTLSAD